MSRCRRGSQAALFRFLLQRYHYLGHRNCVGENLKYLARDREGRLLACLLFGSAAWKAAARDRWIGWSAEHAPAICTWSPTTHASWSCPGSGCRIWPAISWDRWPCACRQIGSRNTGIRFIGWRASWNPNASRAPAIGPPGGWRWGAPPGAPATTELSKSSASQSHLSQGAGGGLPPEAHGMSAKRWADLVGSLRRTLGGLPDRRTGDNAHYAMEDIGSSAFSVFFTQSPSFLSCQKTLQQAKGRSNAQSLFQVEQIPCDNHIRQTLDPVPPEELFPLYDEVFESLQEAGCLESWRAVHDTTLLALDGTVPLVAENPLPQLFLSGTSKRRKDLLPQRGDAGHRGARPTPTPSLCARSSSRPRTATPNRIAKPPPPNAGWKERRPVLRSRSPCWATTSTPISPFVGAPSSTTFTSFLCASLTPTPRSTTGSISCSGRTWARSRCASKSDVTSTPMPIATPTAFRWPRVPMPSRSTGAR